MLPRRVAGGLVRRLSSLPRIVEPHHHYVVTSETFHEPLHRAGVGEYLPEKFVAQAKGLNITKAVHLECAPTDPLAEAEWVETVIASNRSPVCAIVAACNLASDDAAMQLQALRERCPHVVGIRYVVDFTGPFGEAPATHFFVSRHGDGAHPLFGGGAGVDFLRDPILAPRFEAGFGALAQHGLTFDLQCAPEQLDAAATMISRHPDVRVVIDHLGKPRLGADEASDAAELNVWRAGMSKLAALDNVYVKLSMLGYTMPGWAAEPAKEAMLADLVRETIDRFGPERSMFSTKCVTACRFGHVDLVLRAALTATQVPVTYCACSTLTLAVGGQLVPWQTRMAETRSKSPCPSYGHVTIAGWVVAGTPTSR